MTCSLPACAIIRAAAVLRREKAAKEAAKPRYCEVCGGQITGGSFWPWCSYVCLLKLSREKRIRDHSS